MNAGAPYTPGGPAAGACEAHDQRGVVRLRCDIGALEREVPVPATITVTSTVDQPDAVPGDGICATGGGACTLRAAIQEANRLPGAQNVALPAGATCSRSPAPRPARTRTPRATSTCAASSP